MFTATPLVVTEHGTGFIDGRGELRKAFGTHVSPAPTQVRPATAAEARAFFESRLEIRRQLTAHYSKRGYQGD